MQLDASRAGSGPEGDTTVSAPGLGVPGHPGDTGFIPIVHAAPRFVVVNKPSGMLSVPGKGPDKADCAASRVAAAFPAATGPLVVHRLDMETSGLMVFGLDAAAQRELSAQFEGRVVQKNYVALVPRWGPSELANAGTVDLPMRADIDNRPLQVIDHDRGRPAVTHWRLLTLEIDRARLQFEPVTGRTHQLRVHAAAGLGRPILGDVLYGGDAAPRLMLHAATLSFLEPGTSRRVTFESPAPF